MSIIPFSPPAIAEEASSFRSIAEAEALLGRWFDRPVVFTSSGRAALLLALRQLGLNRYGSRLAMPPRTAQCVLDAVIRAAFPIDPAIDRGPVDATLLIHQYGHVQQVRPKGVVIEDICHSFFAGPTTGARPWLGALAIFSLPKFFGLAGMCGGLVVETEAMAAELRQRRDDAPSLPEAVLRSDRDSWRSTASDLEHVYLRALLHPRCSLASLAGLGASLEDLRDVGARRAAVAENLLDSIPEAALCGFWREQCRRDLPYAIPLFGDPDRLRKLLRPLREIGIDADIYTIDRRCNFLEPVFETAILLPCHHSVGADVVDQLRPILSDHEWIGM